MVYHLHTEHNIDAQHEKPDINDLPDEVLALVFLTNTAKESNENGSFVHDPYRTTISTILVCRRWYEVAIQYPALWSRIIDYQAQTPQRIERLLALSKSTIFDVGEDSVYKHVRLRDARGKAILSQIFERSSTMRTLSLGITFAPWDFICKQFLQHPAVSLEYLNLITSCPFPDCLFPGQLFADNAPRLRRLHLQRCLIDFSSPVLANLTELSVMDILAPKIGMMRRPDHPLKVAPTAAGWLRILENIPSLRYLTLSNAISPPIDEEEPAPAVNLPCLLLLTIGAKFHDSSTFFDRLSIPPSCGIRLRLVLIETSYRPPLARLLTFLSTRLSHWQEDTRDRYMQAKILSGDRIHFGNSRRVGHIWDMTEEDVIAEHSVNTPDPLVWLVLNFNEERVTLQFFNDLLSLYQPTYPTTTMLDLWFDDDFVAVNSSMTATTTFPSTDILKLFTAVKALNLLERSPLHLLPILQQDDQILFPSLRSLRLTRTNFEAEQRTAYHRLLTFLLWRAQVQARLTEVQLIESRIAEDTQRELEEEGNVRILFGTLSSTAEDIVDDDP